MEGQSGGSRGGASQSSRASALVNSVLETLGGQRTASEVFVVHDFIESLEIVNKLDQDGWLRARFAAGDPDWLQALPNSASQEDLATYWRSTVKASLDTTNNLVTLSVKAFTPEDSTAIAQRIIAECQALLSRMMERARHDRMADGRALVARAQERYVAAQAALRNLRADEYFIDPSMVASDLFQHLMRLISARISLDVQLRLMEPNLSAGAPQLKVLKSRIAALDAEIVRAKAALTDAGGSTASASNYLAVFEELETEKTLSLSFYQSALDTLERVRLAIERQAFYLAVFVPPIEPDHASGPNSIGSMSSVGLAAMLLWIVVVITGAASRDQVLSRA